MLSLAGKQRDQRSSVPRSKQRKKRSAQHHTVLRTTNDKETKEDLYNKLQTLCDKLKEKDMTILMRDLNAKIGSDNSGYEEVMGNLVKINENGEMLADICAFNNMIIGGRVFPHPAGFIRQPG